MTMTGPGAGRSLAGGGRQKAHEAQTAAERKEALLALDSEGDLRKFGEQLAKQGFTAVRRFLEELRQVLREFTDEDADEAALLIERVRKALPDPGKISPSWQDLWREFEGIVRYKSSLLREIPASDRDGEWQVLIDNPYSHEHIAVYPGLSFLEAAYMYAYFRTDLEKHEYIRLQKVETVIWHTGEDPSST